MMLRFEWDLRKAEANLAKHGVSFEDAATAFGDTLGRIERDPRHSVDEERRVLFGYSRGQRFLAVMFVERDEVIRLISARLGTRRERREYEESTNQNYDR
jgi:uncharacterized DUF497 family protein